jgi:GT2 family glycosyltransferase
VRLALAAHPPPAGDYGLAVPRPSATVVVPFAGPQEALERCLHALAALELRSGDEVLIADNRPDPRPGRHGAIEVVDAAGPASSYFARAQAAGRARGEWLVFTDADCVPDPGLLDALLDPAPAEGTAVLAGAIEDWVQEDSRTARYVATRRKLDQATTLAHPQRPYAQTANCAVRRTAFEAAGGFPDPVRSGGDADLCWRLAGAGWRMEERPAARVRHRNRAALRDLLGQLHRHGSGMAWLQQRWPGSFPPPRPRELAGRFALLGARGADARMDFLCLWARDLGRLRANGDPTGVRRSAP